MATTDLVRKVTLDRHQGPELPEFKTGDTIGVHVKIKEGEKERIQLFKGIVLKIQGSGMGRSFTVRKVASGVGVERTFPFASPAIAKIDLVSIGKIRRNKLYYLRKLSGRAAKIESELVTVKSEGKKSKGKKAAKAEEKSN
ncbi:MAG: 50S ribosomal protein L19 [Bdellovibrionaceae bacterium]|nr:50S ribosomal protein L19 [Pseudobdellovibrionaceae bacterium]